MGNDSRSAGAAAATFNSSLDCPSRRSLPDWWRRRRWLSWKWTDRFPQGLSGRWTGVSAEAEREGFDGEYVELGEAEATAACTDDGPGEPVRKEAAVACAAMLLKMFNDTKYRGKEWNTEREEERDVRTPTQHLPDVNAAARDCEQRCAVTRITLNGLGPRSYHSHQRVASSGAGPP
ncbi:hypothetical protein B0H19DRAFT_1071422 [Mycena capillaripes]|nr:hypothetical protein B0H19DRAFT_1071422 [Mycena capillaripes]